MQDNSDGLSPEAEAERLLGFFEAQRTRGVAYCRRIVGDAHAAEDIYQEGWLRMRKHVLRHGALRAEPERLLYRVLSNLSFNYLAKHERRNVSLTDLDTSIRNNPAQGVDIDDRGAPSPQERADKQNDIKRVADAVRELGPLPRQAFVMKEFEERSYKEIAEALKVSESNVGVLIFRARERLRQMLSDLR